jgi:hypothetical protein
VVLSVLLRCVCARPCYSLTCFAYELFLVRVGKSLKEWYDLGYPRPNKGIALRLVLKEIGRENVEWIISAQIRT